MNRATPKQEAPALKVNLLGDEEFDISNSQAKSFTLLVFYRGLHCPLCQKYLQQLQDLLPEFEALGVNVLALSMDSEKRARLARQNGIYQKKTGLSFSGSYCKTMGIVFE